MSILLIANCSKTGGGITVQVNLLKKKLDSENLHSFIFNTKRSWIQRFLFLPIQLFNIGKGYSTFHIHGCSYAGFYPIILGVVIAKILQKRIIITYHGGDAEMFFNSFQKFVSFFFKQADKIIVQSAYLAHIFNKIGHDVSVVPNIIEFCGTFSVRKIELSPKIITTRNLKSIYGIGIAIKAFSIIQAKYPDASLCIVGTGPEEKKLKNMITEMKLGNVHFTGSLKNDEVYSYLKMADIWCNPSTKDNMPVSLLEAINMGLVIVSTNVGGIPYMVEHQKSALLVPVNAPHEIANAIFCLIDNQKQSQVLINNAKSTLVQYRWENVKSKLLPLYN